MQFSQFFQLLSDDTRLRSLVLLHQEGELCVCELVDALDVIQPKVSRHLAALRDGGVVSDRRAGQWVYYRIEPELAPWARQAIDGMVCEAVARDTFIDDRIRLAQMSGRPGAARCA